jgi:arginyl-tRNA synthetase
MLMRERIGSLVIGALAELQLAPTPEEFSKIEVNYPDPGFGDYSTNAALIMAKHAGKSPKALAEEIVSKLDHSNFEKVEIAGPGFINFVFKADDLFQNDANKQDIKPEKILIEYFQPNIAKPLHIGHMRTAIIGDCLKRMLKYVGHHVESDTHMGDWGTQFGFLILGCKKMGNLNPTDEELNKIYVELNAEAEKDPSILEAAKQEFVELEKGDSENREIWKHLVETSVAKFMDFAERIDLLPFEHHWPESFYEDKMPQVLTALKEKGVLKESQGAQIVDLENQNLGVAVIVKSDGGTTYLLRDLATFIFCKQQSFLKHLYVVDNRQSHHYRQLFAILKLMGEMEEGEGIHIDYGFMSFKGAVLSTRKGNMVLAEEVLEQAAEKVANVIEQKNPDLANKQEVVDAVSKGAVKYFDLSHNRHSDIEFDWEQALDFEGNTGPYLQYTYARLSSIVRKEKSEIPNPKSETAMSPTERQLLFQCSIFNEKVSDSLKDYLPNVLANYLYGLATLVNKFYHESPVIAETDAAKKELRLWLVHRSRAALRQGLELMGIKALEEM